MSIHLYRSAGGQGAPIRWRSLTAAALTAAVLVTSAGCGADDDKSSPATTADPSQGIETTSAPAVPTSEPPTSASVIPSSSAAPSAAPTTDQKPVKVESVREAQRAGFPVLTPTVLPDGWTLGEGSFDAAGGGSSTITFTDGNGAPVTLVQSRASVSDLVAAALGTTGDALPATAGTVDLSAYGVGRWKIYPGGTGVTIARTFPSTAATVTASTQDIAAELARSLIIGEESNIPDAG